MVNFVAWFTAIFPFALAVFWYERTWQSGAITTTAARRWLLIRVPLVLGVAAAMFLSVMAVYERGFSGPAYTLLFETLRGLTARVLGS